MSHYSNNGGSSSSTSAKPPIPAHFQAPLPVAATVPKEYNPTYVAPSPLFMTGVPGTFGAGWDGNGPGSFQSGGGQQHSADGGHPSSSSGPSYETARQIATLQSRLDRKLGPEYVSQRAGPGGSKLTYIEGWKVINVANEVFGFNGWASTIQRLETDFCDTNPTTGRVSVGISAIIRITLRDGTVHEDVGYGEIANSPSKAAAFDKCKKEAITDGIKRSLRSFGNVLGNCLYDKEYTKEINKMKTPTPRWDPKQLYRRPEFDEFGSRDGITTDPVAPCPQAAPSSYASSSAATPSPAHVVRSNTYASTPAPHYNINANNNLARSAMNNNHNQNAAASSSKGPSPAMGGGRPNLPPTPVSLPRANTAPVSRPAETPSIDDCVPMEMTASQQMEAEFDNDMDLLTGIDLDAAAYAPAGASSSSARRKSVSQEAGDAPTSHKPAQASEVKPRPSMAAPAQPIHRAATAAATTTNAAAAPRAASKPASSPVEPSSGTSSSAHSTASNPTRSAHARPPPTRGGFNYPNGQPPTSAAAAPPPSSTTMKRNHSVAVSGGAGGGAGAVSKGVGPLSEGAMKRAQSIASMSSPPRGPDSFVPASKVARMPLGELPLEGEVADGSAAKRPKVTYGPM